MADITDDEHSGATLAQRTAVLVENHRAFLRYLERRLGNRETAEDILQDAFVRNIERLEAVPEDALVPWFYRVRRNALIDPSDEPEGVMREVRLCQGR